MAINKQKLLEAFQHQINNIPEIVPGYHNELFTTISDIIYEEHRHTIQATNIQQKVTEYCDRLGKFLFNESEKLNNTKL